MNQVLIGQVAGTLALLQIIPYVISILRGNTKPERASFFIWLIVDAIAISSYIAAGAHTTIWTGLAFTFSKLLIFVLSIKRGMGGFSKFDVVCLLLALLGVTVWITTKDALMALYFGIFVMLLGYLPTIRKVYVLPRTENKLSWTMAACASVLNLLALTTLAPHISLLPICGAAADIVVVSLLLLPAVRAGIANRRSTRIHALLTHPVFSR